MTGGAKNFKGKRNGFENNPQNINQKGRPVRGVNKIKRELEAKGYEPIFKSEIQDFFLNLMNLTEDELKELSKENTPIIVKIAIEEILGKKGYKAINDILDRCMGKAIQMKEYNKMKIERG